MICLSWVQVQTLEKPAARVGGFGVSNSNLAATSGGQDLREDGTLLCPHIDKPTRNPVLAMHTAVSSTAQYTVQ
jgi:hypothetical protein